MKKITAALYIIAITGMLGLNSCKDNNQAEGNIVEESSQVDNSPENGEGTAATQRAVDTTSKAEEDSLIEQPTP